MWSLFDMFRRRFTSKVRPATSKGKTFSRRCQPWAEALEDRCVPATLSITQNLNATTIASGDTLWFSSSVNSMSGVGTTPADIYFTNQSITFSDTNGGVTTNYNLSVPNAVMTITPGSSTATTTFNSANNEWVSNDAKGLGNKLFAAGYALQLPSGLHGGDSVTWTATLNSDTTGVTFSWQWAAATYTSFTTSYNSLGVKPCDNSSDSVYLNSDSAGSPESYKTYVVTGGTGTGGTNYTGNLSTNTAETPTYVTPVSLSGVVYNDINANGSYGTGDTGISGVTLTLTGTTTGGQSVSTTTTTASDGTYSFTTSTELVAGTYTITETEPTGDLQGTDTVGAVNGTTDGTLSSQDVIGSITLAAGQSGAGYNFGELVPVVSTVTNTFTNTAIASGRTIWFTNVANVTGTSAYPATIYVTNQVITFSDTKSGVTTPYTLYPSNAQLTLTPGGTTSTTTYNSATSTWITNTPTGLAGNEFLSGYAMTLASALAGNDTVTWTGTFSTDTAGLSVNWSWGAAVYTSFTSTYSSLGVKPCDSSTTSSYSDSYKAGTPESYRTHVATGALGSGGTNYTGMPTSPPSATLSPRYTPVFVSLAGIVYNDLNASGTYNSASDVGISGVTLTLTGTTTTGSSVTATTTSSSSGAYSFTTNSSGNLLTAGTYTITESAPTGYTWGSSDDGTVNGAADGTLVSTTSIGTITLTGGQFGINYNFGNAQTVSVGGTIYQDTNGTGTYSVSDPGITGVALTLSGTNSLGLAISATATSTSGGAYTFNTDSNGNPILPGTYQVAETQPSGYVATGAVVGAVNGAATMSISGTQYLDPSGNGFASDDVPQSGTSVYLYNSLTNLSNGTGYLEQTTTDSNGAFSFTNLASGTYYVQGDVPSGYIQTGGGPYSSAGVNYYTVVGTSGLAYSGYNFDNYLMPTYTPTSVSYTVTTPSHSTSTVSDLGGNTQQGDTVTANFTVPAGANQTLTLVSYIAPGPAFSDATAYEQVIYQQASATYAPGSHSLTVQIPNCYYQIDFVCGSVINQLEPSQNGGTYGPDSANVTYHAEDRYIASDNNGTVTATSMNTASPAAPSPTSASMAGTVASTSVISSIVLTVGETGVNYNFGDAKPVAIGGTVYQDTAGTNVYSVSDPGIAGVNLTLSGTNGLGQAITATTTTGSNGAYSFTTASDGTSLLPGTYKITETQPTGYLAGATTVGTVNSTTDGTVVSTGVIGSIALTSGQTGSNYNFGDYQPVSFSGIVYQDTNGSGVYTNSTTDPGLVGATLTLSGTNGLGQTVNATTTSGAGGAYSFGSLRPGTYVVTETVPSGYTASASDVGTVGGTTVGTAASTTQISAIALTSGQVGSNYNFGDYQAVSFAGIVYQDTNGSGVYTNSTSDPALVGATLTLTGTDGLGHAVNATTTSGAGGAYSFGSLRPGTYVVTETVPSTYLASVATLGKVGATTVGTVVSSTQISSIALTSGQTGSNYNFGDYQAVSFAGIVYQDTNGSGVYTNSTSDPGVVGVTLTLSGTDGLGHAVNATTTTGAGGAYSFGSLRPGTYVVTETVPGTYVASVATLGKVGATTVGTVVSSTQISSIALTSGQTGSNYNFGDYQAVSFSGIVYQDTNGSGVYTNSSSDPGVVGVTLTLSGTDGLGHAVNATTTSGAGGAYSFGSLRPGTYQVTETIPNTYLASAAAVGTVGGTADGSVVSSTVIGSIGLTSGQVGANYNFGDYQTVSFAGIVYQDTNGSGVYTNSSTDPGVVGATLTLTGTDGLGHAVNATTTTGVGGAYSFGSLRPGTYIVTETVPSTYTASAADVGTVGGTTVGTVASTTQISAIALTSGQTGSNYNFGDYQAVSFAGIVYQDTNGSGVYTNSTTDPGVVGVTLTLSGTDGLGHAVNATTTTGAGGAYSFGSLRPGTYVVTETVPGTYVASVATLGKVGATTVGTVVSSTQISSIALTSGQTGANYNFGDYQAVSFSGIVYQDTNGSGVYTNSTSDPGIAGVTLTLSGTDGLGHAVNATTTSGVGGAYSFGSLRPGTYIVTETIPNTYLASADAVGTVGGTADGSVVSSTVIGSIGLTSGQVGSNYNFGDYQTVSFAGIVYQDTNGSGVYTNSTTDPGLVGTTLTLTGTDGLGHAVNATTTSGTGGAYSFGSLRPGNYVVTETVPSTYTASAADVGTVGGTTVGTVASTTQISAIALTSGQTGANYNFGDYQAVSFAGIVYQDTNGSGVYTNSTTDPGIVGATLTLTGTDGLGHAVNATTTTGVGGAYSFGSLRPGTYQVTETIPNTYLASAAAVGTVGGTADGSVVSSTVIGSIGLTSGQVGANYNFGDYQTVSFAGIVYQDTNGSGVYTNSASDPALVGVTLTLTGTDGLGHAVNATTTSGAGGAYSFGSLRPGTYVVTETVPSTYTASVANVGKVGATAVGTAVSTTQIASIALTSGQTGSNYNFGDFQAVSFSGIVYQDTNGSGVYTNSTSDPGVVGVTLTLSGTDGLGHAVNATTTTGAGGAYSFGALRPGTYVVTETVPSTYVASVATLGKVGATTVGTVASMTQISAIVLTSGQTGANYNFGDYQTVSFAGIVYQDTNGSGVYTNSSSDPGLVGATLTLTGTDGLGHAVNATTTTGAGGAYSFGSLRPGTYQVTETIPGAYVASAAAVGTVGGTADGSVVSSTVIGSIGLTSGQVGSNYNFGDYQTVSFAGIVYQDTNGSGVYTNSSSDPGIVGATLTLTGTDGLGHAVNATTTSGVGGAYSFGSLRPGNYVVTETVPSTYTASAADVGTVGGTTVGTVTSTTQISAIALTSGQTGANYNFGDYQAVSFAGIVYQDTNASGVYTNSTSDPGVVGVTLTLSGTDGLGHAVNATTTTGAGGAYSFGSLRPGTYVVTETVPGTYVASVATLGKVGATTVGTVVSSTQISSIALTSGQTGANYNFGDYQAVSFSGIVYQDTNGSGVYTNSSSDPGLVGATLTLSGTDGLGHAVNATTTTGAGGAYSFGSLRPGTYIVTETIPNTYLASAAAVGTVGGTADGSVVSSTVIGSIGLTSGQVGSNYNFGDYQTVSFAGIVYQDTNGSGVYTNSSSDPGLVGATLTLTGTDGLGHAVNATTTSGAGGAYSFGSLRPGNYVVTETVPSAYTASAADVGTVGGTTVGTVASTTQISAIALTSGQTGANYNFGDYQAVSFAGIVYQDTNGSGVYTNSTTDPGVVGVTLTLSGTDGLGHAVNATTTTGAGGAFSFGALRPGTYQVTETIPSTYTASAAAVGTVGGTTDGSVVSSTVIGSIALTSGQTGSNYRFGDYQTVSFAGIVYQDTNASGVYTNSTTDPGVVGVTLTLSGTDGLGHAVNATTTTGAGGAYSFGSLRPGTYQVTETTPNTYLASAAAVGTVGGTADGSVVSSTVIGSIGLTSGQVGANYNFGDYQTVSFAGIVYQDTNGSGVYTNSSTDPGVVGATLTLTGTDGLGHAVNATTTSGTGGAYSFGSLRPGTYQVTETIPNTYLASAAAVGTVGGTADGAVVSSTVIGSIGLTSGQTGANYNFGDYQAVSFAGIVYQDTNGSGVYTNSTTDPGVVGVTLTLTGTDGLGHAVNATTTTGAGGAYSFGSFRPGTYKVTETVPSGYLAGAAAVGSLGGTVVSSTVIGSIGLTSGQSGSNYNFGDYQPVTISGIVYVDTNGNGLLDSGETGIGGVAVTLNGTNGLGQVIVATATTAANGTYTFSTDTNGNTLRPGNYQVSQVLPSGYLIDGTNVGTVGGTTVGSVVSTGVIGSIVLTSGQVGSNYNFGDFKAITVGGIVYQDTNGTGAYNASDAGISGVTLTLTGTNGLGQSITATATTAADGTYTFTLDSNGNPLHPGTYQITEAQPSGYLAGATTVGTVNGTADGSVVATGIIGSIVVTSGQVGANYRFGDVKPVSFGGTVYQDTNGNAVFDAGEPGIAGVTLSLSGANGLGQAITATTATASDGTYSFALDSNGNSLRPGTYQVTETQPSGYLAGATAVGTVNGVADGTVVSTGVIGSIVLTSGQAGAKYNFGEYQPVSFGGTVYQDINGNGVKDAGETGISGITMTLKGTNGLGQTITATTTTAANGAYSFTTDSNGNTLRPGTYQVTQILPSGYVAGAAAVGTVNGTTDGAIISSDHIGSIALTSDQAGINYNFGDIMPVAVIGTVYQDANGNNVFDAGEPGIAGVTLALSGTNGLGQTITGTATTLASGFFSFTLDSNGNALLPGTYQVTETQPSGYLAGSTAVGTANGATDGTVVSTGVIGSIVLTSGEASINNNFGELQPVSLGGTVYKDMNSNGVFDSGDQGIAGVTMTLTGTNGLGQSITATTTTGSGGAYSFSTDSNGNVLRPGTYQIAETAPSGYIQGTNTVGTVNDATDGTLAPTNQIGSIVLTSGQAGVNFNFGQIPPITLSGVVYFDANANGMLDTGEVGIAGVALTLTGTTLGGQSVTATTTTGANGAYTFTTDSNGSLLSPGTYQIAETQPSGYLQGFNAVGTINGTADGSLVPTDKIGSIAAAAGQNGLNYDFGEVTPITVGGTVYQDNNLNQVIAAGDPGIAGVVLTLTGTNNLGQSVTATATTAADGTYTFTTDSGSNLLAPGSYTVTETTPANYAQVAANVGKVNGVSDGAAASSGVITSIVVVSGQNGINYNFGLVPAATLSGTVYVDLNKDLVLDSGDTGYPGDTVSLTGTNLLGQSISLSTTTDANGNYAFGGLLPGTYSITVAPPFGIYNPEVANVGTVSGATDGVANASELEIDQIVLSVGAAGISYDVGFWRRIIA